MKGISHRDLNRYPLKPKASVQPVSYAAEFRISLGGMFSLCLSCFSRIGKHFQNVMAKIKSRQSDGFQCASGIKLANIEIKCART